MMTIVNNTIMDAGNALREYIPGYLTTKNVTMVTMWVDDMFISLSVVIISI